MGEGTVCRGHSLPLGYESQDSLLSTSRCFLKFRPRERELGFIQQNISATGGQE